MNFTLQLSRQPLIAKKRLLHLLHAYYTAFCDFLLFGRIVTELIFSLLLMPIDFLKSLLMKGVWLPSQYFLLENEKSHVSQ